MFWSKDFNENEIKAKENGQRDIVTYDEVLEFVGGEKNDIAEMLMDILNNVYSVEDCINDIKAMIRG